MSKIRDLTNIPVQSIIGKNRIINGALNIWQRATSFSPANNTQYTADRFIFENGTSPGRLAVRLQQAGLPEFPNCLQAYTVTAEPTIAAGNYYMIGQRIEGYNIHGLIGKPFTLSFWVRASIAGKYCVNIRNSPVNTSYIAPYQVNNANTWEFKSITVPTGLTTDKVFNTDNTLGCSIMWCMGSGSNLIAPSENTWLNGNYVASSGQVNVATSVDTNFYITGIQLEAGSVATPFEHLLPGVETSNCQRYFEDMRVVFLTNIATAPPWYNFRQLKRVSPSLSYNYDMGGSGGTFSSELSAIIQGNNHSINTNGRVRCDAEL